jgi:mycothiol system anti-sigma-R factor
MSCGKPHEVPCSEVLARVYSYLDDELDETGVIGLVQIRQHLDECGPCLREYGLEEAVRRLVHKCCGRETAPSDLRAKVLSRIRTIRAELEITEITVE